MTEEQESTDAIAEAVAAVQGRIRAACGRAGRDAGSITLLGVTKTVAPERIAHAVRAGVMYLGENYVQEAQAKIPAVADLLQDTGLRAEWHLIGNLQRNKARVAVELFDVLQTVDRSALAESVNREAERLGRVQRVLIEVNLSGDPNRGGVLPDEVLRLAEQVSVLPGLRLRGLMGVPPMGTSEDAAESARPHFARLRELWGQLPLANRETLSMGMSGDFETAIEEGATLVRVGTTLFGARPKRI